MPHYSHLFVATDSWHHGGCCWTSSSNRFHRSQPTINFLLRNHDREKSGSSQKSGEKQQKVKRVKLRAARLRLSVIISIFWTSGVTHPDHFHIHTMKPERSPSSCPHRLHMSQFLKLRAGDGKQDAVLSPTSSWANVSAACVSRQTSSWFGLSLKN